MESCPEGVFHQASARIPTPYLLASMTTRLNAQRKQLHNLPRGTTALVSTLETRQQPGVNFRDESWGHLVRTGAERFSPAAGPVAVKLDVLSTIALPYNSDIACDVIVTGLAMIIEHHRTLANRDKLVDDLTAYVTEIAEQNGLLPVS
jgi:hypothetical protein